MAKDLIAEMQASAEKLRALYNRINETFRKQPHGPEHTRACAAFHDGYDALAFPGGLHSTMQRLKANDREIVEAAIQFLEASPRFFRSGYIEEDLLRHLKHCVLSDGQRKRLAHLIMSSLTSGGRRRFVGCARLAGVIHLEPVIAAAQGAAMSTNPEVQRRGNYLLSVLKSRKVIA